METFVMLNKARLKNSYISNQLKTYKKYANLQKRECGKSSAFNIFALESNTVKFKMTGSINYLLKNLRILKKFPNNEFRSLYSKYTQSFIDYKRGSISIDLLIELRQKLGEFYCFLDDIYFINDNRHDFEQYRIKYLWKDVTIVFETNTCLESFLNKTFILNDFRFNTQLALKILDFEKKMEDFIKNIKNEDISELDIFTKSKELNDAIMNLDSFLADNYVDSQYVLGCKKDCAVVLDFFKMIMEFKAGKVNEEIDAFTAPNVFHSLNDCFEKFKRRKQVDPIKLRSLLLEILEREMKVNTREGCIPLMPIFYDLAFDFVEYKKDETPMSKLMRAFSLSRNN